MRRVLLALLMFCLVIGLVITGLMVYLMRGQKAVLAETIEDIVFAEIADGVYTGSYEAYRWSNELKVTVEGGQIVVIEIVTDQRIANDVTSIMLFENVKRADSLNVDTIAGGTVSSIAYLKAIEDALSAQGS